MEKTETKKMETEKKEINVRLQYNTVQVNNWID